MTQNNFDINTLKLFPTSSGLDGDITGIYEDKVVRVFSKNFEREKNRGDLCPHNQFLIQSCFILFNLNQVESENIAHFINYIIAKRNGHT